MSFHIKRSKVEQDWHKRENQKKRVINTVIHMLNRATVRDLNTVLALINQNRNIDDIINLSVHEINLILPDLINTERRLTRLAIRQFNDLTEEAEVVFNDYYRRISDDVVTKNTNIMNGTTRLRTRDFLRKFIGAQDLDDAQKVRDALTQKYLRDRNLRNDTNARTTSTQVLSRTDQAIYDAEEIVETKRWETVSDDRVRPAHRLLDGETVPKDQNFSNGLAYPSEYRCRCTTSPGFREEDDIISEFLEAERAGVQ